MITKTKAFSGIMLTLLLSSMLVLTFSIQPVESDWTWTETVYIRTDGSIDPPDAPISTADNITYTLTSNIAGGIPESAIAIIVERDDIIFDGAGHTVEGINASDSIGVVLNGRRNVTIANMEITLFAYGILLCHSNYTRISENNITENGWGIRLYPNSHYNIITANNITKQYGDGIRNGEQHTPSNHNVITDNNVMENMIGIYVAGSSNISITLNRISASIDTGVRVDYSSSYVEISQNNMTYNGIPATPGSAITIWNSTDCQVIKNWIASNNHGLIIDDTSQIEIVQNDVFENNQGVKWVDSSSDAVYHNNFVDNSHQVYVQLPGGSINSWDNGYPSGGNYWSDYAGIDLHSGPNQDEVGSDGMGDTPYIINENNTDHYPLANPWPSGWKLDFVGPTNHPIVDFAIYNGSLYAAADNRLHAYDGSSWNVIAAPTFVTSLETVNVTSQQPAPIEWSHTYGGTNMDYAYDMIQTSDSGYALAGFTWSFGAGIYDFWLVKTDSSGNILWNQTYGGTSDDVAYVLVQTADGGYALAGYTYSFGAGGWDMWLVKTDADGIMQWNRTIGGASSDIAYDLMQTDDGGYALAGYTFSYGSAIDKFSDYWLVKTDADGNVLWNRTYGGSHHDMAHSLVQTGDGGYALAGQAYYLGAGAADFWLVRTDADGYMLWNKTYGGAYNDWAETLIQTDESGFALAGTYSTDVGEYYFWLVRTDSLGNMEWNKTYERTYSANAHTLMQTSDGGYALAGEIFLVKSGQWDPDFWLIKTDASGNAQWNQTYGGIYGDSAYALAQTNDGGYALAGYTFSVESQQDFWLIKTESYDDSEERLIVGGKGGLYCYDGTSFDLIFSVPTYIKVLGVYNNTLYAGTMLDNPPKLYYCNGSADNPAHWHVDASFSSILNFSGAFGSMDSFWASSNNMGAPVGYWKFDEGVGSVAFDSSGNNFDGAVNGANWTDGILNRALEFDGQDDYVEVLDSAALNPSLVTVIAWVKFRGFNEWWRCSRIVAKGTNDRANGYFSIDQAYTDPELFRFILCENSVWYLVTGITDIAENVWYHVAGTYDGSTLRIYVNGMLEGEQTVNVTRTSNTDNLQVGTQRMPGFEYWFNGTIDEVKIYDYARTPEEIWNDYSWGGSEMYTTSGGTVYCYNGTDWRVVNTLSDVYAILDMQVYNGKLYLATRDQGWRKPYYQGGTGFSGRVIEFDGASWTTVLDHDYWVYSLGVYDGKLYAGTANRILTYDGSNWETSFSTSEGAYYAMCFENYDDKIYVGMGNGYIFADPISETVDLPDQPPTIAMPEFPSTAFLILPMISSLPTIVLVKKRLHRKPCTTEIENLTIVLT